MAGPNRHVRESDPVVKHISRRIPASPENTRRLANAGLMFAQRLWRCANIKPTLVPDCLSNVVSVISVANINFYIARKLTNI